MPNEGALIAVQSARLKRRFLESFARTGNITESCRAAGVQRRATIYDWQERDEAFAAAFREAELVATEVLEAEARRRAVDGVIQDTPIVHRGSVVAPVTETKYSDSLLIFLLKARAPEKYRERYEVKHGGTVRHALDLSRLSDAELETLESLIGRAAISG